jgi:Cobalt transport protein
MKSLKPAPAARVLAFFLAVAGVMLTKSGTLLGVLLAACVAILVAQFNFSAFIRFASRLWLPLAVGLCVVWGVIVRGSPFSDRGAGMEVGFRYAGVTALRLLTLVALFQAAILSLRGLSLASFLARLGFSPDAVASLVSIFNLWPAFAREASQIITARCARGLMPDRRAWTRVKQLPWALRTLFVGSLGESFERAERWEAEGLPQRLVEVATESVQGESLPGSALWVVAAAVWMVIAIWTRL